MTFLICVEFKKSFIFYKLQNKFIISLFLHGIHIYLHIDIVLYAAVVNSMEVTSQRAANNALLTASVNAFSIEFN